MTVGPDHPLLPPASGHAEDLLSAHLDGELDGDAEAWVRAHLEACGECADAATRLLEARSLLRRLPSVDATAVVEGYLGRHRRLVRGAAAFVALACLLLGVLGARAAVHRRDVLPDVAALVRAHDEAEARTLAGALLPVGPEADLDPSGALGREPLGVAGDSMEPMATGEELDAPYAAPAGLIGSAVRLSRTAVFDGPDLTAVVYRDGDVVVSVFEQPGRVDLGRLGDGELVEVAGVDAWLASGTPRTVVVTQRGDLVVTVVSDDRAAALTAVGGMPALRRRSTVDRLHDAAQRVVQVFALDG